jgi:AraC-like DNA-binding protein
MEKIINVETVAQYNALKGQETLHPLVSVIDFSNMPKVQYMKMHLGLYTIFLKDVKCGDLVYGRKNYDYQEGTLVFIAPGQVIGVENTGEYFQPKGYALVFHPDLLHGTSLGHHIKEYSFFSYEVSEALHLSEKERQIVIDCLHKIDFELRQSIDKHSKTLIVTNIELFLNYCMRFYDRQFITRANVNSDTLARFERLLDDYFLSDNPQTMGLPSVRYCADQLHLSANYLGDLIKKETGKTAQEHIQLKLMDIAKEKVFDKSKSVSEIAYELGFKYPQHFTRMFKKSVGQSPNEYRLMN